MKIQFTIPLTMFITALGTLTALTSSELTATVAIALVGAGNFACGLFMQR